MLYGKRLEQRVQALILAQSSCHEMEPDVNILPTVLLAAGLALCIMLHSKLGTS